MINNNEQNEVLSDVFETEKKNRRKTKILNRLLITGIIIYPLLLIWQGIDFSDEGFNLTNYQQIFNDPHCIALQFSCWLTNVIGGIWLHFFGALGLLGVRIGGTIIVWITVYLTYKIFKKDMNKTHILLGLFIAILLSNQYLSIIHYDNVSALFFVLTIYFLMKNVEDDERFIYLAGAAAALNVFARFPNIMGILLLIPIFIYNHHNEKDIKFQMKQIFDFFIGFGLTAILVLLIMKVMGHYDLYINSIVEIFKAGGASAKANTHSVRNLIKLYWDNDSLMIITGAGFTVIIFLVSKLLCNIKNKILLIIFGIGLILLVLFLVDCRYAAIIGMLLFITFFYIIVGERNIRMKIISFMALLLLILLQVGTNVPTSIILYGIWIACPILVSFLLNIWSTNQCINFVIKIKEQQKTFSIKVTVQKFFSLVLIMIFICCSIYFDYGAAYRDSANRFTMRYTINNTYARGIFTTKDRAKTLNELLPNLSKYAKKDDYMIAGDSLSTLYYLTETKPYLYNTWTSLDGFNYGDAMLKALNENKKLPVIVMQNVNTGDRNWPQAFNNKTENYGMSEKNLKVLKAFMQEYNYKSVWKNTNFEIFVSDNKEHK